MTAIAAARVALRIDALAKDDIAAVLDVERRSNSHPWSERNFLDALASGYLCLAARIQGNVSGFAIARLLPEEAELLLIAVAPEARRQGVATALWQALVERLRIAGARVMHLEVRTSNISAQAFYAELGLVVSGQRPRYYPSGAHGEREDALLMQGPL
ncbi:MAG: ribosomal protein S18-alanine N-acetyltransferase [Burkholderiales bacterium]|nr:ribosomal protein S18-alanine N-acetyltransferase [Burkholderiales bacterium]